VKVGWNKNLIGTLVIYTFNLFIFKEKSPPKKFPFPRFAKSKTLKSKKAKKKKPVKHRCAKSKTISKFVKQATMDIEERKDALALPIAMDSMDLIKEEDFSE